MLSELFATVQWNDEKAVAFRQFPNHDPADAATCCTVDQTNAAAEVLVQTGGTEQPLIEQVPFQTVETLDDATDERVEVDRQEESEPDERLVDHYEANDWRFVFALSNERKDHKIRTSESSKLVT